MKAGRPAGVLMPATFSITPPSPPRSPSRPQTPGDMAPSDQPAITEYFGQESTEHTPRHSSDNSAALSNVDPYALQAPDHQGDPDLPPLQVQPTFDEADRPITDDDPGSYDLVLPSRAPKEVYSLEKRSQNLFSREHLQVIFTDPALLFRFTSFLSAHRPKSVPILVYYLDALKAIRALHYANAICDGLDPIEGFDFTSQRPKPSVNLSLEQKANSAFDVLVKEELPAYITHLYIQVVSLSISRRVTGALAPHLQAASEGLAEVFCLTDPSRPDNPIVFASEEFNRTTQYGMGYVLGRNCRFLQGPWTNPLSVRRLKDAVMAGREQSEVLLNYRRDGSPFMNLLMTAPLWDSRGKTRYFIGAQVDVSGLVKECTELESLQRLLEMQERGEEPPQLHKPSLEKSDELRELSEMLNQGELSTIHRFGGRMHRETIQDEADSMSINSHQPRLLIKETDFPQTAAGSGASGKLSGVYQNYLLVRPYPSLRILFASRSLRVPGILQSPFLKKIGGSDRVRDELTAAMAEGRGVTAKVRWVSKSNEEGRSRWIHCTPLLGGNGQIGVWMVVIVDEQQEDGAIRRWRQAPPVPASPIYTQHTSVPPETQNRAGRVRSKTSGEERRSERRTASQPVRNGYVNGSNGYSSAEASMHGGSVRSHSPTSLRID